MARGSPDYTNEIGRQVNPMSRPDSDQTPIHGSNLKTGLASGVTVTVVFSTPPDGFEYVFKGLKVSVEDNTDIHRYRIWTTDDSNIFLSGYFKLTEIIPINEKIISAGNNMKVEVLNNAAGALDFRTTFFVLKRKII